jgi:hypothetical protein
MAKALQGDTANAMIPAIGQYRTNLKSVRIPLG